MTILSLLLELASSFIKPSNFRKNLVPSRKKRNPKKKIANIGDKGIITIALIKVLSLNIMYLLKN
jgi:hypothetical protein